MNISVNKILSFTVVLLLGASLFCDATAAESRDQARAARHIEACVAEIGRHADYEEAARVIHLVTSVEQRNADEVQIDIETSVTLNKQAEIRAYRTSCLTDPLRRIVDFRFFAE